MICAQKLDTFGGLYHKLLQCFLVETTGLEPVTICRPADVFQWDLFLVIGSILGSECENKRGWTTKAPSNFGMQ